MLVIYYGLDILRNFVFSGVCLIPYNAMVRFQKCFNPQVFGEGDEVEDFDEGISIVTKFSTSFFAFVSSVHCSVRVDLN